MSRFVPLFAVLAVALGGCSSNLFSRAAPLPACPMARALDDANRITVYRPGPGRDITDIAYEARIIAIEGDCAYTIKNKSKIASEQTYSAVAVTLRPRFLVTPGPALTDYKARLNYFTAIPEFYPRPEGRADFSREVELPVNRTQLEVTDTNIDIDIPLNEKRHGETVEIYLGFALTEEQLRENRSRAGGRLQP